MRRFISSVVVLVALAGSARAEATPRETATTFFDAFCKGDMATLERIYAPDVKWKDPIFSFDDRDGTMGMWRILLNPNPDSTFTYKIVSVSGDTVVVNWLADYKLFGRPIHNDVTATLVIKNGRIVSHEDVYSWKKWARQAFPLGPASNWFVVKPVLIGALNLFLKTQILWNRVMHPAPKPAPEPAVQKPSPTRGLNGALQDGVRR